MQEITFDELSTLNQPSASLRTALDKISAALGSVGDAGQQARSVVDELRVSLRAAAAQSVKSARSLAKFDEINRLSAPAEDKTAAPEKQKKAAEAAAKAEEAARSTTGTAARRSGTAGSDLSGLTAVWQSVLESLRGAWADFWAYLQEFFAPFAAAWQTVWQGLSAAAINGLLSAIGHAKSMAGSVLGGAGKLVSSQSALLGLGYAASVPVPALAQGAVIPPNRQFLAMLGDQTTGTNVEAPLATIKQAMAETLAGWQGSADGQPINIYIGEELLDSVIANSQNRRALRSGGR